MAFFCILSFKLLLESMMRNYCLEVICFSWLGYSDLQIKATLKPQIEGNTYSRYREVDQNY